MKWPGFLGPTNKSLSPIYDGEETINFYLEVSGAGSPKSEMALYGTPGLRVRWQLAESPIRCTFFQDDRFFVVAGGGFYELFRHYTSARYGSVHPGVAQATIASNGNDGNQLLIVSAQFGYTFDLLTNTLTPIADGDFPGNAAMCAFLDGRGFVLQAETDIFQWSALEDFTDWDPLDFGKSNQSSDTTKALVINRREIWLFGSQTTSVWAPTLDPDAPYAPIGGVFIQQGIDAPFSAQPIEGVMHWLGQNEQGGRTAYRANGYDPQRISTHAIELEWARLPRTYNVIGWTALVDGHAWYVLHFPSADYAWVYDATTSAMTGAPVWFKLAHWDPAALKWFPFIGRCHAYAFSKHYVGDRQSGAIYEWDLDFYDEELITP